MAGSNISYSLSPTLFRAIGKLLGFKRGTFDLSNSQKCCTKAGAPATNTAADAPDARGDFCLNTTGNTVFVCSAYTSSTVFVWTQIA